jgi:hypothetical protein
MISEYRIRKDAGGSGYSLIWKNIIQNYRSPDREFNFGPAAYDAGVPTTRQLFSVTRF